MSKDSGKFLAVFLTALLGFYAVVTLAKGGIYLGHHEVDALHVMDIVFRMSDGERPHLDFATPIGMLAFAPFVIFVKAGVGIGKSFILGQLFCAAVALPATVWVAYSRFRPGWSLLFGASVVCLFVGLIDGGSHDSFAISMHYNRWAWALTFLVLPLVMLPARGSTHEGAEGVIIGLAMAFVATIKMTYFAALLGPMLVALIMQRKTRTLLWALLVGLLVVITITAIVGTPQFWAAYIGDLLNVAGSEVRPNVGRDFATILTAPAYLGGTLIAFLSVMFLRQAGYTTEGLALLLLLPGLFYVTYQNWGNDPQWLWLLGLLMITLRPGRTISNGFGWDLRQVFAVVGTVSLALSLPSFLNIALSPVRHLVQDEDKFAPLLSDGGTNGDVLALDTQVNMTTHVVRYEAFEKAFGSYDATDKESTESFEFRGRSYPYCQVQSGSISWYREIAGQLSELDFLKQKALFIADILPAYWLFDDLKRMNGVALWYYGDLKGIQNADVLFVPRCSRSSRVKRVILKELLKQDWLDQLDEIYANEFFILYSLPGQPPKRVEIDPTEG